MSFRVGPFSFSHTEMGNAFTCRDIPWFFYTLADLDTRVQRDTRRGYYTRRVMFRPGSSLRADRSAGRGRL